MFRDIPDDIVNLAVVKYPWNETSDTPMSTGIPPHIAQLAKLELLQQTIASLKGDILGGMTEEMDKRGFSSTESKTSDILAAISAMSEKIVSNFLEKTDLCKQAAADAT